MAATVRRALQEADGNVLAFLPGRSEIRRTQAALESGGLPNGRPHRLPLFGARFKS